MKYKVFFVLAILIVVFSFLVRLYHLSSPLADWHSFRQADTASVTREYVKHGINLLVPKYQDLSNVQSGYALILMGFTNYDNIKGYRMVEFPMINGLIALFLRTFPTLDLVVTSRLFSIVASIFSLIILLLLVTKIYGKRVGLLSGLLFGFLPFSIYYSRSILPEPFLVLFILLSMYTFLRYNERNSLYWLVLTSISFACALLLKPMAIFYAPVFLAIAICFNGWKTVRRYEFYIFAILSVIPLYFWRKWIMQFPAGVPYSTWLYNQGNIRFKGSWFYWLFSQRLSKLILGYFGILFFSLGFVGTSKRKLQNMFIYAMALGMVAYVSVFAAGNVQHDYYQYICIPFLCIVTARGIVWLLDRKSTEVNKLSLIIISIACIVGMFAFSWFEVRGYYDINHPEIVTAGQAADKLLPKDAKVIAPYGGDTAFLFQINRTGWPVGQEIDKKIGEGAKYYVSVNYDDETNALLKKYAVIAKNPTYVILDLTTLKN